MSIYQTHFDVTVVKCLVTTKINVVDTLYAATAVSLNIVDHLACVANQSNVSTAQVITLQTQSNAHNGRKRRKFLKIKCENNLSFPEAPKQYEQFYTGQTYASAVKPGTCNKSTQTDNKSTQTDDSFTEYLKQQEQSSSEKTAKETPMGKQDKNTSIPRTRPALKPATLEMMKKEEERKKKEEKDRIKQQQKDDSNIIKINWKKN